QSAIVLSGSTPCLLLSFFFQWSGDHRHLHSFPTRRSSDLNVRALVKGWRLERRRETTAARAYCERLHIRPPDPEKTVGRMSGGNQQKVLLARWLFAGSQVFLLDEPTRGVDVAARAEIYRAINKLTEAGAAVVMVS